jgi:hypothetical protein
MVSKCLFKYLPASASLVQVLNFTDTLKNLRLNEVFQWDINKQLMYYYANREFQRQL